MCEATIVITLRKCSLWIALSRKPRIVRIDLEMMQLFNLLSEKYEQEWRFRVF